MKRVLYVSPFSILGGTETWLRQSARWHDRSRYSPAYAILRGGGPLVAALRETGAPVYVYPHGLRLRRVDQVWRCVRWLRDLIDTERPHVVCAQLSYGALFASLATRRTDIPHLWVQHGPIFGWLDVLGTLLPADAILLSSEHMAAQQRRLCRRLHRRRCLGRVRLGPELTASQALLEPTERAQRIRRRYRRSWGVADDDVVFGMVTRLVPWKGADFFVRAFARAVQHGGDVARRMRGVIVGSPPVRPSRSETRYIRRLRRLVRSAPSVQLRAPTRTPLEVMLGLDVLVSGSRLPEPFGLTVVEAMSVGRPVVAPAAGGPAELICDGETGWLYPPRDVDALARTLVRVAKLNGVRTRIGSNALQATLARGGAERGVRELEDLYDGFDWPQRGEPLSLAVDPCARR